MKTTFLTIISASILLATTVLGSCSYKGTRICDGAVTKELKSLVQICLNGRLTYKKYDKVPKGYPLAGGGENRCFIFVDIVKSGGIALS